MAKRFTDTGKWDKAWFRVLDAKWKCVWIFLCDRCDHAGVWDIDEAAFDHFIGQRISIPDVLQQFGDRVQLVGKEKLLVVGFLDFQYGTLNPENRVHASVLTRLAKLQIKGLARALQGSKDKDKEKDKDKAKDKDKDPWFEIFEKLAKKYRTLFPGTTTGPNAFDRFKEQFPVGSDVAPFDTSMDHYRKVLNVQTWRQPKTTVATYLGTKTSGQFWRDYIMMPEMPANSGPQSLDDIELPDFGKPA